MAAQAQIGDVRHAAREFALVPMLVRWTARACALALLVTSMWVVYSIVQGADASVAQAPRTLDGRPGALAGLETIEGRILSARVNGSARLTVLTERYVREIRAAEPVIGRIEVRARLAAEARIVEPRCPTCARTLRAVRTSLG